MSKLICFRVDEEQKARIENAANDAGQSVTTFIKESIMATVDRIEARSKQKTPARLSKAMREHRQSTTHQAIIEWLRNLCEEATKGGSLGFREVGERFSWSIHFRHQTEHCAVVKPGDEWGMILQEIDRLLARTLKTAPETVIEDDAYNEQVWSFVASHFSDAAKLIPSRRRHQFLLGMYSEVWQRGKGKPVS
jgi:hypothetical protein